MFSVWIVLQHPIPQFLQQVHQDVFIDQVEREVISEESFLDLRIHV